LTYPDFSKIDELIERNKRLYLCKICKKPTIDNLSIEQDGVQKLVCERCWEHLLLTSFVEMRLSNEGR